VGAYAPKGCVFTLSSSSGMRFGVRWAVLAPLDAEDPQIPEGIPEWRRGSELDFVPRFRYEENTGFPSERQELFALTRHYFSLLWQYFHLQFH